MSTNTTLLIVDDDEELRLILSSRLQKHKFITIEAESGEQAIEKLKTEKIDLVLSDLRMGEISGIDLLRWTKEHKPMPFFNNDRVSGYQKYR